MSEWVPDFSKFPQGIFQQKVCRPLTWARYLGRKAASPGLRRPHWKLLPSVLPRNLRLNLSLPST